MSNFASRTESTRDDWQTPLGIVEALGPFDLDPCANCEDPTRLAPVGYTLADNGMSLPWPGRVFLNPPYGAAAKVWLNRLSNHGNGIALIPPRLGSHWFHRIVLARFSAILFLRGRVSFLDPNTGLPVTGNNADSILVAYGENNAEALACCGLSGVLWRSSDASHPLDLAGL